MLSKRAMVLLTIIGDATKRDEAGKLKGFFWPSAYPVYYGGKGDLQSTTVSGAGDVSALRGLERKGLIEPVQSSQPYCYSITAAGRCEIQQ